MNFDFESLIDDFTVSQHYFFLDKRVKEHAAGLLAAFVSACGRAEFARPSNSRIPFVKRSC